MCVCVCVLVLHCLVTKFLIGIYLCSGGVVVSVGWGNGSEYKTVILPYMGDARCTPPCQVVYY